jgi:N-carbamoylputrescine amidase
MTLAGADILLYPSAIGWDSTDTDEVKQRQRDAWITIQRSHAIANGLPVAACNRTGYEEDPLHHTPGIDFWGSSFVCGPQGEIVAMADTDQPAELVVEIDLGMNEDVRRLWPYLRDRRIDSYQDLTLRIKD